MQVIIWQHTQWATKIIEQHFAGFQRRRGHVNMGPLTIIKFNGRDLCDLEDIGFGAGPFYWSIE